MVSVSTDSVTGHSQTVWTFQRHGDGFLVSPATVRVCWDRMQGEADVPVPIVGIKGTQTLVPSKGTHKKGSQRALPLSIWAWMRKWAEDFTSFSCREDLHEDRSWSDIERSP